MKTPIFWFLTGTIGVLIGCDPPEPAAPTPPPVPPVVKLSPVDSANVARLNYNGDRPIWDNGDALPVYNTIIVNGPNDTVYFNKGRWNHWPVLKRRTLLYSYEGERLEISYSAGMSTATEDIYEGTGVIVKRRLGLHKEEEIIAASFSFFHVDVVFFDYRLDTTQDNWVSITNIDEKKGTASGSFSLHYSTQNKKPSKIDRVYPNTIHLHGSFQ